MFEELKKYKTNGHFFFKWGDNLRTQSKDIPEMPGVYYIMRLAMGQIELVYIGKAGTVKQNGKMKDQLLRGRINNKSDGMKRQIYFEQKFAEENIDGLDIYWFVTMDTKNNDLPAYVEGVIMQRYFEVHDGLPPWNKCF
jgi:hypothetical protein